MKLTTVDIDDSEDMTALHYAAEKGHTFVVNLLILNQANIECRNKSNNMPIHLAAKNGHVETVKFLLKGKSNHQTSKKNKFDWTNFKFETWTSVFMLEIGELNFGYSWL